MSDAAGLSQLVTFLSQNTEFGFDVETDPRKDYYLRRCRTIQFGNADQQFLIDLKHFEPDLFGMQGEYGKRLSPGLRQVITAISPFLEDRNKLKVGVMLSFEYLTLYWLFGVRCQGFFDCALVERIIYAGAHSLKDYSFYSMAAMMGRYYGFTIEKKWQESFNLDDPLIPEQVDYACMDTRLPLVIMRSQKLILGGCTHKTAPKALQWIDPVVLGDNLTRIAQIENDAIGAFVDMHVHGERIDRDKWLARTNLKRKQLADLIANELDPVFLPLVGYKSKMATDEELAAMEAKWKYFNNVSISEVELKADKAKIRRSDPQLALEMQHRLDGMVHIRKQEKNKLKAIWSEHSKHRTMVKNLAADCDGEALCNYNSGAQMLVQLNQMEVINTAMGWSNKTGDWKQLTTIDYEELESLDHIPVINALRRRSKLAKEISTYGEAWVTEWVTHPCNEEGWLHPKDHRLHCTYNQLDAETGRSSSEQPNAQNLPKDKLLRSCFVVDPPDSDEPDGYVMITADMSGAELRILAELARDPVWIKAFKRGEDVHAVCIEMIEPYTWKAMAEPGCPFYQIRPDGLRSNAKCECAEHKPYRDGFKPVNFGIPYGMAAPALSRKIGKTREETEEVLFNHQQTNPIIWEHLDRAGANARATRKSFDMFKRRRLFPLPTWERAKALAMEYGEERLRLPKPDQEQNLANFTQLHKRKPTPEEKWKLNHKQPTDKDIKRALESLHTSVERQGKNHEIQGTNASIAKVAMGAGHDADGQPYLWHTLGRYKARLVKFVHDELVVVCPARLGEVVAALIGDAFKRAAAEVMSLVTMEFEYNIAGYWKK